MPRPVRSILLFAQTFISLIQIRCMFATHIKLGRVMIVLQNYDSVSKPNTCTKKNTNQDIFIHLSLSEVIFRAYPSHTLHGFPQSVIVS